jgi:adenylate cyclase
MIQLGATVFDPSAQMLRDSAGAKIALRAQSARVLECLIEANGGLVSKEQLFNTVWAEVSVTDDSLVQCIREIRTAIGDAQHAVLQTESRRGYRLVVNGHDNAAMNGSASMPAALSPSTQSADGQITPAIAVMAFSSMDGDERSERLAMTFAGDLITELARHKELRVIGRFSSFALRGQQLGSKEVCEKLNARYIVSGQVQFTETTIQWSLEMMDGRTDEIIWSERKQVKFSDIDTETAALFWRIAGTINTSFRASNMRRAMAKPPDTLAAYDLCARASAFILHTTIEGTREGQRLATEAVQQYPHYARAWRALAQSHMWDINFCHTGLWKEAQVPQALQEIHKAIELDNSQALAYVFLANLLDMNGQHEEALLSADHALVIGPGDSGILQIKAMLLFFSGRFKESKDAMESLFPIVPVPQSYNAAIYGRTLFALGERSAAINVLQETLATSPGNNNARIPLIVALEEMGEHRRAGEHFKALLAHTTGFDEGYFGRRWSAIPDIRDRFVSALRVHGLKPA